MPFNLGMGEVLVILLVALLVLGPDKLPGAARNVGRFLGEMRRMSAGFQAELRDALQEPVDGTPRTAASAPAPKATPRPVEASGTPAGGPPAEPAEVTDRTPEQATTGGAPGALRGPRRPAARRRRSEPLVARRETNGSTPG